MAIYKVEALKDPHEPPAFEEEPEPITEPSPHDRDLSSQEDGLRPHRRTLGVRRTTPPPHSRDSSVWPGHISHQIQDLPPPHSQALGVRPTASLPHGRDPSPRPLTDSFPSCHDEILGPSATTRLDRDKLQGDDNLKLYGKEEPSFMETCYTTTSLQPTALQDQEEKLAKQKREVKGPMPMEFYEGRKILGSTGHNNESHPLRALEEGEIYNEKGDPPYEIIEGELEGLSKARPRGTCHMIDSPSV